MQKKSTEIYQFYQSLGMSAGHARKFKTRFPPLLSMGQCGISGFLAALIMGFRSMCVSNGLQAFLKVFTALENLYCVYLVDLVLVVVVMSLLLLVLLSVG